MMYRPRNAPHIPNLVKSPEPGRMPIFASTTASVAIASNSEPIINIVTPADADIVLGWYLAAILS